MVLRNHKNSAHEVYSFFKSRKKGIELEYGGPLNWNSNEGEKQDSAYNRTIRISDFQTYINGISG